LGHWEFDFCKTGSDRTSNLEKIGNFGNEQSTGFNGWMLSQEVKREDFSQSPPLPISPLPFPLLKKIYASQIAAIGKKTARLPYRKH
jgi:hypothetical protein